MLDDQALMEALNSTPAVDGRREDRWQDDRELGRWAREHGGIGDDAEERRWLRAARDALQATEWGTGDAEEGAGAEAGLRRVLAGVRKVPRPGAGLATFATGIEWHLEAPRERRLAVELVLAWADVKERMPGRLRPCGNPECRLFLLDRSRANTARWCSMKTCGNRLKARRHQARARVRGESGPGPE
ncbi:CGNR zinc finger domain-containing protein [Streptomyces sp. NPDC005863]|uniref:CGNR zinc finger domain-containing protein n=1 Tax=unclassified Streptomyces TaxID=2593676 RepID=UPI0033F14892